jgi:hypothetical protein
LFLLDLTTFKWEQIEYPTILDDDPLYPDGVAFHQMVHISKPFTTKKNSFSFPNPIVPHENTILEEGVYTFGGRCRQLQYDYPLLILKRNFPLDKHDKSVRFTKAVT